MQTSYTLTMEIFWFLVPGQSELVCCAENLMKGLLQVTIAFACVLILIYKAILQHT